VEPLGDTMYFFASICISLLVALAALFLSVALLFALLTGTHLYTPFYQPERHTWHHHCHVFSSICIDLPDKEENFEMHICVFAFLRMRSF
jgi:hypothetical protein